MNFTHIPCPFCGLSRAFANLLHLKFIAAIKYNPLVTLYAPILLGITIIQVLPKKLKIKLFLLLLDKLKIINTLFIAIILISLIFGIVRIFDHFFHFINFKEVIPEKTILKYFKELIIFCKL